MIGLGASLASTLLSFPREGCHWSVGALSTTPEDAIGHILDLPLSSQLACEGFEPHARTQARELLVCVALRRAIGDVSRAGAARISSSALSQCSTPATWRVVIRSLHLLLSSVCDADMLLPQQTTREEGPIECAILASNHEAGSPALEGTAGAGFGQAAIPDLSLEHQRHRA